MSIRYITVDDFKDVLIKVMQRGLPFVLSKLHFSEKRRTQTAFDNTRIVGSNCWDIPYVKKRWNTLITGNEKTSNIDYIVETVLKDREGLKLLSLGSGTCKAEIELAKCGKFSQITCIDLSEHSLRQAKKEIERQQLNNIKIQCADINEYDFEKKSFDVVLFNGSLHHFKNVNELLSEKIKRSLKTKGLIIINEFVGAIRLQFSKNQINAINEAISVIPKKYRKIHKTPFYKSKITGPGIIRMILADPSECVDSSNILPALHKWYVPIVEKPFGGSLVMLALKDIAHHFCEIDNEKSKILDEIFALEDAYISNNNADYVFGVYGLK